MALDASTGGRTRGRRMPCRPKRQPT
jgi:hypothetical protein